MANIEATYDPADDKIRLRADSRLDADAYARVKGAGFGWAPKQDLFFAVWSPGREDLAIELAGDIEEEQTTREERAEVRAERFAGYRARRAQDAERARKAVSAIADNIPLGQPILVGHHSERHARRDVERIENGMRKAVKSWETSEYWRHRASACLGHAEYMERPDVRARRIKKLESECRCLRRDNVKSQDALIRWGISSPLTIEAAKAICNEHHYSACFPLDKYPRNPPASQYEGSMSFWSALDDGIITPEEARTRAVAAEQRSLNHRSRWISHLENRLTYERAMLGESGYTPVPKLRKASVLPLLNIPGKLRYLNRFSHEVEEAETVAMTKAQFARIPADGRGTVISADKTYRIRHACWYDKGEWKRALVHISDSKTHEPPTAEQAAEVHAKLAEHRDAVNHARANNAEAIARHGLHREPAPPSEPAKVEDFAAIKQALKAGVQVVSAPQLFPTPPELADRMVEAADIEPGQTVLEPSAGTGNIIWAIAKAVSVEEVIVHAVEINTQLAGRLQAAFQDVNVHAEDFLRYQPGDIVADRILMNPPFERGSDIAHIKHARSLLAPGGRLVAICANGPRQQEQLRPLATTWEELPEGTFASEGTNVRTVMLTIEAR